jgi:hypothetical protein
MIMRCYDYVCRRWTDVDGQHKYKCLIPDVDRPGAEDSSQLGEPSPGEKRKRQPRRETDKGALFYAYDPLLHEWITHLRRVHWMNSPAQIGGQTVKACDPLAPKGVAMYYVHSRTAYYNNFFFDWWYNCFVKTFGLVCPFYDVQSIEDLETLLNAEFIGYDL